MVLASRSSVHHAIRRIRIIRSLQRFPISRVIRSGNRPRSRHSPSPRLGPRRGIFIFRGRIYCHPGNPSRSSCSRRLAPSKSVHRLHCNRKYPSRASSHICHLRRVSRWVPLRWPWSRICWRRSHYHWHVYALFHIYHRGTRSSGEVGSK